jgi:S1-C subfamily serine protease
MSDVDHACLLSSLSPPDDHPRKNRVVAPKARVTTLTGRFAPRRAGGEGSSAVNWVDFVLLGLVALSGIHGLRLGAAMQVLSFGGFWLGLFLGALIAPSLAGLSSGTGRTVIALVVVFGMATIFGGLGRVAGTHSHRFLHRLALGPIDSAFGVGVAVVATLLAAWLVSSFLVSSRYTSLDSALQKSRIVRALDNLLPPVPNVFSSVERFLAQNGFPIVFAGLPPQTATPVAPPSNSAVRAAVLAAEGSTVQVAGSGCGVIQEGSGFVASPDLVVTNAHVVAGIPSPVVIDGTGRHLATPVLFDPHLDIAVLRVPGLSDKPLALDDAVVARGSSAVVLGFPGGGSFTYAGAGVAAAFPAVGLDIYGRSQTTREIYELDAVVQPGNSGGPLVASGDGPAIPDGTVIGVVFARSTTNSNVGYALALPAVIKDVNAAQSSTTPVGTGDCVS